MKFVTALNKSVKDDFIYVSIGSNVGGKATEERLRTQQYPKFLEKKSRRGKESYLLTLFGIFQRRAFREYLKKKKISV